MIKGWIIVADSSQARIFEATSPIGDIKELKTFEHPQSRMQQQELQTDRPGRSFDSSGAGRHGMEARVNAKQQEAIRFAKQIVEYLEAAHNQGDFQRLVLVAGPEFLGILRSSLNSHHSTMVDHEIQRDLTGLSVQDIRKHLPERLYFSL